MSRCIVLLIYIIFVIGVIFVLCIIFFIRVIFFICIIFLICIIFFFAVFLIIGIVFIIYIILFVFIISLVLSIVFVTAIILIFSVVLVSGIVFILSVVLVSGIVFIFSVVLVSGIVFIPAVILVFGIVFILGIILIFFLFTDNRKAFSYLSLIITCSTEDELCSSRTVIILIRYCKIFALCQNSVSVFDTIFHDRFLTFHEADRFLRHCNLASGKLCRFNDKCFADTALKSSCSLHIYIDSTCIYQISFILYCIIICADLLRQAFFVQFHNRSVLCSIIHKAFL